jgi:hypothetical protein
MSTVEVRRTTSRREFARTALIAAIAAPARGALPVPAPASDPAGTAGVATRTDVADALFAVLLERHGHHLDAGQRVRVRRDVEAYLRAADRLRSVRLDPAAEPALLFRALREEG